MRKYWDSSREEEEYESIFVIGVGVYGEVLSEPSPHHNIVTILEYLRKAKSSKGYWRVGEKTTLMSRGEILGPSVASKKNYVF